MNGLAVLSEAGFELQQGLDQAFSIGFVDADQGKKQRYEDLLSASSEIEMQVGRLRVLNLEALIAEKKRMGRLKDKAAVELLEEVLRHRSDQN